jgi:hypothetical protein
VQGRNFGHQKTSLAWANVPYADRINQEGNPPQRRPSQAKTQEFRRKPGKTRENPEFRRKPGKTRENPENAQKKKGRGLRPFPRELPGKPGLRRLLG